MKIFKLSILFIFILSLCQNTVFAQRTQNVYDNAHRLIKVIEGNGTQVIFTLDAVGKRLSKSIIVPCTDPDLIISNITVTARKMDKIQYTFEIKNIGVNIAYLNSIAFGATNSADGSLDGNDDFKGVIYVGGSLPPNATMSVQSSSGFNYGNGKYYLIISADYNNNLVECSDVNNNLSALANPCTHNGDVSLTGVHSDETIATNGKINSSNGEINSSVFIANATNIDPKTTLTNTSIVTGGCLNIPANAPVQAGNTSKQSPISNLQFTNSKLFFTVTSSQKLTISVYGDTERKLIGTYLEKQPFESGFQSVTVDTSTWVKGQKYTIHLKDADDTEALLVEW